MRYGINPPVLERETSFIRPDPENDGVPDRGKETYREEWTTYLATEDEWRTANQQVSQQDVSVLHDHVWWDDQHPYIAAYQYDRNCSSGPGPTTCYYWTTSPINVVFDLRHDLLDLNIDNVAFELDTPDWYSGTFTCEYTRYAWNSIAGQFQAQHKSAMTKRCGVWDPRYHVRYWEFGDFVSMQAH